MAPRRCRPVRAPAKAASVALRREGGAPGPAPEVLASLFGRLDQVAGTFIVAGTGSRIGTVLSAIAISGGTPEQDDEFAKAAAL